jgi:hypothetical protein
MLSRIRVIFVVGEAIVLRNSVSGGLNFENKRKDLTTVCTGISAMIDRD